MFYELEIGGYVRVPPDALEGDIKEIILNKLNSQYGDFVSSDIGTILHIIDVVEIGEGIIIPGDGAAYYETKFKAITFKPELQEIVLGKVTEITDFGAFMEIGPIDGMIHISQTMDDFVSFNKSGSLTGKETKRSLKPRDKCRARIIAVSYKDLASQKIGLTMRQPWLGNLTWIEEDLKKIKKEKKE